MRARFELANLRLKSRDYESASKDFMLVAILYDDERPGNRALVVSLNLGFEVATPELVFPQDVWFLEDTAKPRHAENEFWVYDTAATGRLACVSIAEATPVFPRLQNVGGASQRAGCRKRA